MFQTPFGLKWKVGFRANCLFLGKIVIFRANFFPPSPTQYNAFPYAYDDKTDELSIFLLEIQQDVAHPKQNSKILKLKYEALLSAVNHESVCQF